VFFRHSLIEKKIIMKNIVNKIIIMFLGSVVLWGCTKDDTLTKVGTAVAPALTSSATAPLTLTEANKANTALTLNWSAAEFGYNAAVTYTVQFATSGTNFASPKEVTMDAGKLQLKYTVEELNSFLQFAGYDYGVSSTIDIRVKATINSAIAPVYSNVKTLTVTPYEVIIIYPTWYVAGTHQADPIINGVATKGIYSNPDWDGGWNPGTAPEIMSKFNDGVFKGYLNFPGSSSTTSVNEFKVVPVKSWSGDIGGTYGSRTTGGVNTGTVGGGNNMKVVGAGYYLLEVNFNTNTYKASPMNWGVIGDATPTGWDSDTDFVYDPIDGKLKLTIALTGGKSIKFRANDGWDDNFGDNKADKVLDAGGDNIAIATSGTYKIELDLRNYGKLKYSLTKQ
jgi:hypothetical protein